MYFALFLDGTERRGSIMTKEISKLEKSLRFPVSDFLRVVAMLLVVCLTVIAIKIGAIFSPDKGGVQAIESAQLTEEDVCLSEGTDTIKELSS